MLLPHNKVSGGVQDSQIMIPSFFDRFYVMPPLTNGVHYNGDALRAFLLLLRRSKAEIESKTPILFKYYTL